jgi:UDP-N-acetylglucosamine 2-epimerase (non-hydrolysing)
MATLLFFCHSKKDLYRITPIVNALEQNRNDSKIHICYCGSKKRWNKHNIKGFEDQIAHPDIFILIKNNGVPEQIGELSAAAEKIFLTIKPDLLIIPDHHYLALATANTASSMGIKICIMNAGFRVYTDDPMTNFRAEVDSVADLQLCHDANSYNNLKKEGIANKDTYLVNNPLFETITGIAPLIELPLIEGFNSDAEFGLAYFFSKAESFRNDYFMATIYLLAEISTKHPLVIPIHENNYKKLRKVKTLTENKNITLLDELNYPDYLALVKKALFVVTDTNSIQEECQVLNTLCITVAPLINYISTPDDGSNFVEILDHVKILRKIDHFWAGGMKTETDFKNKSGVSKKISELLVECV